MVSEERRHVVRIFEAKIEIINGISSAPVTTHHDLDLGTLMGAPGRIIDIKFWEEHTLLGLWEYDGGAAAPQLVSVCFRLSAEEGSATRMDFDEDLSSFAPCRMEVLGADNSRGGVPARVCLLAKDEINYKVFVLPGEGKPLRLEKLGSDA